MKKDRILNKNITFKTAFKATLGFYAAQVVVGLVRLALLAGFCVVIYKIFK